MSIFGNLFAKKNDEGPEGCCDARIVEEPSCGCGGACEPAADGERILVVKVMGTGCKKCHQLHENALEAAGRIDKAVRVEYVTDLAEIAAAGVMSTPAIIIGGTIAFSGKLLSTSEIETLIDQKANA